MSDSAPADGTKPASPGKSGGWFSRFLAAVEWLGNLLPHPVTLFAILIVVVMVASALGEAFGLSVQDPRPVGAPGRTADGVIRAVSLLSGDGIRFLGTKLVTNFTGFAPLGTVLVALLGVGVAERSGLLSAAIRAMVLGAPKNLVTMVVVFAGVLSNAASEMGYVVLIPLAATIYYSLGRHPLAGLAAAFAGVSGGYSANLVIGTIDPLLSGITESAARLIDPTYTVHPAVNWYFMFASTFIVVAMCTWVSVKIVEPRLGKYDPKQGDPNAMKDDASIAALTDRERRALTWAGAATLLVCALFAYVAMPREWAPWAPYMGVLRDPDSAVTGMKALGPFLHSVVPMIFVFFLVPGFVYGRIAGTMRNDRDIIDAMSASMSSMGLYIVLVFFAAQFVECFNYSRLGTILAVVGADALKAMNLDNPLVFGPFIVVCAFINLMVGSASAKWALTAPIFVPMMMQIGYSPEVVQCAYRIGDSTTNIITPMMSYFGLILAFAAKYDRRLGIGTLVATMLPYCLVLMIGWTLFFYLWVFALGLPVGPDAPTVFPAVPVAP